MPSAYSRWYQSSRRRRSARPSPGNGNGTPWTLTRPRPSSQINVWRFTLAEWFSFAQARCLFFKKVPGVSGEQGPWFTNARSLCSPDRAVVVVVVVVCLFVCLSRNSACPVVDVPLLGMDPAPPEGRQRRSRPGSGDRPNPGRAPGEFSVSAI